jgi:hypothetical protein
MTLLIVGFVLLLSVLLYVFHLVQVMRLEKARRISGLSFRYKHTHTLHAGIPPQFLNRKLIGFILDEAIDALIKLKREMPNDRRIGVSLAAKQQALKSSQDAYVKPQSLALSSLQDARQVRQYLITLKDMVSVKAKKNLLDPAEGKAFITHLNWQAVRCVADVLLDRAQKLAESHSYRLAIHSFNNALTEFERLPNDPKATAAAQKCRERIEHTEEEMKRHLEKLAEDSKIEGGQCESNPLMKAWDDELSDPIFGKKKRA